MSVSLTREDLAEVVEIRHDLHAHPELGYEEQRTADVVRHELGRLGIQFVGGLAGGTGTVAYLPSTRGSSAPTVALRADIDALPIHENTGLPYASQNPGRMHACGHDGHTAVLLGTARVLSQRERPNNVLLLFQPAEEGGAGGKRMVEDGALNGSVIGSKADIIFGLHGNPYFTVGQVATCVGPMLASTDSFELKVTGRGGHAAMPHLGVDPIVACSQIVLGLQTIASRTVSPLDSVVVTIGQFAGGAAHNVIPDSVVLKGTIRTLLPETRALAVRRFNEIVQGVASAAGVQTEVAWMTGYPVTVNEPGATERFRSTISREFSGELVPGDVVPVMGGEDFAFYGQEIPACFYWLGLLNEVQERYPNLHAPEFDFNDAAIPYGVEAMVRLAVS